MRKIPAAIVFLMASFVFAIPPGNEGAVDAIKSSPRHGEWVDIAISGSETKLHSFVVYPERKDKAPVVIVIHEIFGLTDWVRSVADALAAEGFIAVAPDLLSGKGPGGGGTDSFKDDQVRGAIQKINPDEQAKLLSAVRDFALALPAASGKSATIGFCWGGAASFSYAGKQPQLNAAVVYYGGPPPKEVMEKIQCPVQGQYGGDDGRITATVAPTQKQMADLKLSYETHTYDKAGHGFLRQQSGKEGANQKAADAAWASTIAFLKKNLE